MGRWTNIVPFKYNNAIIFQYHSYLLVRTESILYFASDRPGGFGGSDLYRCEYKDSSWSEPENLGNTINTSGNEVYPFINTEGTMFFASDGHAGMGKKDLFFSTWTLKGWSAPVHIDPPINSAGDDFSLIQTVLSPPDILPRTGTGLMIFSDSKQKFPSFIIVIH